MTQSQDTDHRGPTELHPVLWAPTHPKPSPALPHLPPLSVSAALFPYFSNIFQRSAVSHWHLSLVQLQAATAPYLSLKKKRRQTHSGLWSADEDLVLYSACDGGWVGSPPGLPRLLNICPLRSPSPYSSDEWQHPRCSGSQKYKKQYLNPGLPHSRDWCYNIPKQEKQEVGPKNTKVYKHVHKHTY